MSLLVRPRKVVLAILVPEGVLLTRLVVGSRDNNKTTGSTQEDRPDDTTKHTGKFKKLYLEKTNTLDRATSHLESLEASQSKGKTPAGLQITVKPQVIHKEDPIFREQWRKTVKECETALLTGVK